MMKNIIDFISCWICRFVKLSLNLRLYITIKQIKMIRTVFTPESNLVNLMIPDKYVGEELEIIVFPLSETLAAKPEKETATGADLSFGAWADMDKSTAEICAEIRNSRAFRQKDLVL
jgi:hypothetical protein